MELIKSYSVTQLSEFLESEGIHEDVVKKLSDEGIDGMIFITLDREDTKELIEEFIKRKKLNVLLERLKTGSEETSLKRHISDVHDTSTLSMEPPSKKLTVFSTPIRPSTSSGRILEKGQQIVSPKNLFSRGISMGSPSPIDCGRVASDSSSDVATTVSVSNVLQVLNCNILSNPETSSIDQVDGARKRIIRLGVDAITSLTDGPRPTENHIRELSRGLAQKFRILRDEPSKSLIISEDPGIPGKENYKSLSGQVRRRIYNTSPAVTNRGAKKGQKKKRDNILAQNVVANAHASSSLQNEKDFVTHSLNEGSEVNNIMDKTTRDVDLHKLTDDENPAFPTLPDMTGNKKAKSIEDKQIESTKDKQTESTEDKQTESTKDKQTESTKDKQTESTKDKQTESTKDKQTESTKDKQTELTKDKQTESTKVMKNGTGEQSTSKGTPDRCVEKLLEDLKKCTENTNLKTVFQLLKLTCPTLINVIDKMPVKNRLESIIETYPVLKRPEYLIECMVQQLESKLTFEELKKNVKERSEILLDFMNHQGYLSVPLSILKSEEAKVLSAFAKFPAVFLKLDADLSLKQTILHVVRSDESWEEAVEMHKKICFPWILAYRAGKKYEIFLLIGDKTVSKVQDCATALLALMALYYVGSIAYIPSQNVALLYIQRHILQDVMHKKDLALLKRSERELEEYEQKIKSYSF